MQGDEDSGKAWAAVVALAALGAVIVFIYIYLFARRDTSKDGTYDATFANSGTLTLVIDRGVISSVNAEVATGACSAKVRVGRPGLLSGLVWDNRFDLQGTSMQGRWGTSYRIRGYFGERGRLTGSISVSGTPANADKPCRVEGEWSAVRR